MPDPDIPPVVLTKEQVHEIQAKVGMLPNEYRGAFNTLNLDSSVVNTLLGTKEQAETVYQVMQISPAYASRVANWFASVIALATEGDEVMQTEAGESVTVTSTTPSVADLVTLAQMTAEAKLSSTAAKEVFLALVGGETNPQQIAEQRNLLQVSDESAVAAVVDAVMADPASQKSIEDIKAGNDKAIGYIVGQVMKKSQGKANPSLAQKLIRQRLQNRVDDSV